MARRRRPCWRCRRPTVLAALTGAHLGPPPNTRALLSADRVVWLCRRCTGPAANPSPPLPSQPAGKEVIGLLAVAFALVFAGFVVVVVIGQRRKHRARP